MSVSAVGSNNPYAYLQSLLSSGSAGASGPTTSFLSMGASDDSAAGTMTGAMTSPKPGSSPFDSGTLAALISMQGQQTGSAADPSSLFAQLDSNGDGSISKSEFESAFGPNANTGKVDALFNKIDSDDDGSVSESELTAAQQSRAHHGHHAHHAHGVGGDNDQSGGAGGLLGTLMSSIQGASSDTSSNSDGSSTRPLPMRMDRRSP